MEKWWCTFARFDLLGRHVIHILGLPERAIEGGPNDIIAIAAAREIGAESASNRRRFIPGIRRQATASKFLGSTCFIQGGIVNRLACRFCVDAFVAKLDRTGSQLVYATYLGGS